MNSKSLIGLGVGGAITVIAMVLVLPLFYNTSIDEALPESALPKAQESMMEEKMPSHSGNFVGVNDGIHNAEGVAKVIPLDSGESVLRLENFKATNGPDLYVYLSTDKQASDFVNLGRLKASSGNQNYEIPSGTDLSKYDNVLIWCKAFGVLFGSSQLVPNNV